MRLMCAALFLIASAPTLALAAQDETPARQATPAREEAPAEDATESDQTPAGSYAGPIIDMHLHGYVAEDFWGPAPSPVTGEPSVGTNEEHIERSLELMRRHNIVLGAVSGEAKEAADLWRERAPDRVLRAIILEDPNDFMSPESFREVVERGELDVLGEVGAQYAGYSPSDSAYAPYWEIAQAHGIPVAIHTGQSFPGTPYACCPSFRLRYGDPLLLEDMLVAYPDLKVYMMHAGGGGPFSENALMMMNMYPQLYTDVGVLTWIPGLEGVLETFLRRAQQMGMLDRVMFGTDQMIWPEAIEMAVERIAGLDFLSDQEKAGIFYHNAARFLGLSDDDILRHHEIAIRNADGR